jgi:hypothetical protein
VSQSTGKLLKRTVFVLGAGASNEVQLPVGAELKKKIATILDIRFERGYRMVSGDDKIVEALRIADAAAGPHARDLNSYLHAARRISRAMPQAISIDNFLDAHQGDAKVELCGKLAIIRSILTAEQNSALHFSRARHDSTLDYGRLDGTWFTSFFQLLTENCRATELKARLACVALVIFNYDRCLEHYLYQALQTYYAISAAEAASLIQGMEIYHPYGTVGSLPWYSSTDAIEFGDDPSPNQLLKHSARINTFMEGTDPASSDITAIQETLRVSMRLVFLGFAFHYLNLDLLLPAKSAGVATHIRRVFATGIGISNSDAAVISADLASRGGFGAEDIAIKTDLKCGQLFREYWRSMSLLHA